MHANVTQQILLVTSTKQAVGTGELLRPNVVGLQVSLYVAAHSGLVWAVWTCVRLFSCVLAQMNLQAAVPVAAEETIRTGKGLFSCMSANVVL